MISIIDLNSSTEKEKFTKDFSELSSNINIDKNLYPMAASTCQHLFKVFPEVNKNLWLAKDGEKIVGRICANLTNSKEHTGYFGFFEVDLSHSEKNIITEELFKYATNWLKKNNVTEVYGPISLNVWMSYRYQTTNDKAYPWEPSQPLEYVDLVKTNGFVLDQGYVSKFFLEGTTSMELSLDRTKPYYDKMLEMGFKFRNINPKDPKEASILYNLNLNAFKVNYLFEPISQKQYEATHVLGIINQDLKYSFFILSPDNIELGYLYTFIDQGLIVVKSIMTKEDQQGAGFASALLHKSFQTAKADGFFNGVGATLRKGNISEKFFNYMGTPTKEHEYYLFKKSLV